MDRVSKRPGPPTSREVRPSIVEVDSPKVNDVVPIVKSFVEIVVEFALKLKGLKLTFSNPVICPKVSIAIFFG